MASPLPPLESRTLSSGLARRTLKNLDFIKKNASSTEAHPVTQVVNSLLGLLVFPVEKEKLFLATFSKVKLKTLPIFRVFVLHSFNICPCPRSKWLNLADARTSLGSLRGS